MIAVDNRNSIGMNRSTYGMAAKLISQGDGTLSMKSKKRKQYLALMLFMKKDIPMNHTAQLALTLSEIGDMDSSVLRSHLAKCFSSEPGSSVIDVGPIQALFPPPIDQNAVNKSETYRGNAIAENRILPKSVRDRAKKSFKLFTGLINKLEKAYNQSVTFGTDKYSTDPKLPGFGIMLSVPAAIDYFLTTLVVQTLMPELQVQVRMAGSE